MMAFTCPAPTKIGIAATVVLPWVTCIDTPPSVVESGNAAGGPEAGPRRAPKMENNEPRAIEPDGNPACMKLAAFTIPRWKIKGCADAVMVAAARLTDKKTIRIEPPRESASRRGYCQGS